jgi:hypothetical protein
MRLERRGALRFHGTYTLAHGPARLTRVDGSQWVYFQCRGVPRVPDKETTHTYTIALDRNEIPRALNAMLGDKLRLRR